MKRPSIVLTVVVAGAALLATACASTEQAKKSPEEIVAERQKVMKQNGDAWKNVQDNAKAGNWPAVAANADIISKNAAKIPALGNLSSEDKTILAATDALLAECRVQHEVQAINKALLHEEAGTRGGSFLDERRT